MNLDIGAVLEKYGVATGMLVVLLVERFTLMKTLVRLLFRIEALLDVSTKAKQRDSDKIPAQGGR